jgi:hypothetical protein
LLVLRIISLRFFGTDVTYAKFLFADVKPMSSIFFEIASRVDGSAGLLVDLLQGFLRADSKGLVV